MQWWRMVLVVVVVVDGFDLLHDSVLLGESSVVLFIHGILWNKIYLSPIPIYSDNLSISVPFRFIYFLFFLFTVDMLSLSTALEQFDSHGLRAQNDKLIDIPDMVTVLTSLYEVITADNPTQVSVPLCIDLAINWLLNVYDRWARLFVIK